MQKIQAGSLVSVRINVYNNLVDPPVLFSPSSGVKITITGPTGIAEVALGSMTPASTGVFTYAWQSAVDDALGDYAVTFKAIDVTGTTYEPAAIGFMLVDEDGVATVPAPLIGINADFLLGGTWASPGSIGSVVPNAGAFTTLTASTSVTAPLRDKGGVVFDIRAYGPTGTANDRQAILDAAAAAHAAGGGVVQLPPGLTTITAGVVIPYNRVTLRGAGVNVSTIVFNPSADGTAITFQAPADASIVEGGIEDLAFYTADTTHTKTAIELCDARNFALRRIATSGLGTGGVWSGGTGSMGFHYRGRDMLIVDDATLYAEKPLRISPNAVAAQGIAIDHAVFQNLLLSGGSMLYPLITIDSGVNLTDVHFIGRQSWNLGSDGLYWVDTTAIQSSNGLFIENARWEQSTVATGYIVRVEHAYALYRLGIRNVSGGVDTRGIKLRKTPLVLLEQAFYLSGSKVALDIDSTCTPVIALGNFFQAGSSLSTSGLTKMLDIGIDGLGGSISPLTIWGVPNADLISLGTNLALTGTVDAGGYKAGGTAGVTTFGPAPVVSITVKNGLVTAIS